MPIFNFVCSVIFTNFALKAQILVGFYVALILIVTNASEISKTYIWSTSLCEVTSNFYPSQFTRKLSLNYCSFLEYTAEESGTWFGNVFSALWHFTLKVHPKCSSADYRPLTSTQISCQSSVENLIKVLMAKVRTAKSWLHCLL